MSSPEPVSLGSNDTMVLDRWPESVFLPETVSLGSNDCNNDTMVLDMLYDSVMRRPVYRQAIEEKLRLLSYVVGEQTITHFSKKGVVWKCSRPRGPDHRRSRLHFTVSICERSMEMIVTDENSPFFVPIRTKVANAVNMVSDLNRWYCFRSSITTPLIIEEGDDVEDEETLTTRAKIDGYVNCLIQMKLPLESNIVASLMLGFLGTPTDVEHISGLLTLSMGGQHLMWSEKRCSDEDFVFPMPQSDLLSDAAQRCLQTYGAYVMRHISKGEENEDLIGQSELMDGSRKSLDIDSSSGIPSDCKSKSSADVDFEIADVANNSSDDEFDANVQCCPLRQTKKREMLSNLRRMLRPQMFNSIKWLGLIGIKKWWWCAVAAYVAAIFLHTVGLQYIYVDFGLEDQLLTGFSSYFQTIFAYVYTWISLPDSTAAIYAVWSELNVNQQQLCAEKWFFRWMFASLGGITINFFCILAGIFGVLNCNTVGSLSMVAVNESVTGDMDRNCSAYAGLNREWFIAVSIVSFLLSVIQTPICCFGITAFVNACRNHKADIDTYVVQSDDFGFFIMRAQKLQKYRSQTFVFLFGSVAAALIIFWLTHFKPVKYFLVLPFGSVLPGNIMSNYNQLYFVLFLNIPMWTIFVRCLNSSLWSAKAKVCKTQIPEDLEDRWKEEKAIAGWQNCYPLVCMLIRYVRVGLRVVMRALMGCTHFHNNRKSQARLLIDWSPPI